MIQGMVKEIIASIVAAGIVAFAGYLFIVKENQLMIRNLSDDLTNIKNEIEKSNSALRATNLFIAQAHPDRDVSMLASMKKLQEFNKQEIKILAESLPEIQVTTSNNKNKITNIPQPIQQLADKYNLDAHDFVHYQAVAILPNNPGRI